MIRVLPDSPEKLEDLELIDRVIYTLETLEKKYGIEYKIADLQEDHLGGICEVVRTDYKPTSNNTTILGIYDKSYFLEKRQKLLKGKNY